MMSLDGTHFPEYEVKCNDFKPLVASDIAESSSNLAPSEQFTNVSSIHVHMSRVF